MSGEIAGVTFSVSPRWSQARIDQIQPATPGRLRYRLITAGRIRFGDLEILGPQCGDAIASQEIWLAPEIAAGLPQLEIAP